MAVGLDKGVEGEILEVLATIYKCQLVRLGVVGCVIVVAIEGVWAVVSYIVVVLPVSTIYQPWFNILRILGLVVEVS